MRTTVTELAEQIDAASKAKFIWNTDYESLKYWFGNLSEKARNDAADILRADAPISEQNGQRNWPESINNLYYWHPQINSFKKLQRLLAATSDRPANFDRSINAFDSVLRTFGPMADEMIALRQYIKKGRKPSDDPTKTPPRTIDHTGTCPVCGRNIKIEHGVMYSHGFVVQGYRLGNCFGVGYPPIEVSDRGAKALLGSLKTQKSALLKAIEDLKVTPSITRYRRDGEKIITNRGEPGFDRVQASEIGQHESVIRFLTSDIKTFEEIIRIWEPKPLPDGNREHMKE